MPYARKNKKTYRRKRKNYRKKTQNVRPQRILSTGFPATTMVKLRYCESATLNPAAGFCARYQFRANSCNDPNQTGAGHQPLGYDQWSVFYNHYVVVGAKLKVTISPNTTTASAGTTICGITLADDTTGSTNLSTIMEQPLTRSTKRYTSISASKPAVITKTFSAKKFFNLTNVTDNISRIGATITNDPSELAYFSTWVGMGNVLIDPPEYNLFFELEQIVIFSEPKELSQS